MKGEAGSITYAAIADSIITTTKEKTDKEIRHNTENALNRLKEIFDKTKVEEKQELIQIQADVDKNHKVINSSGTPRTADCIAVGIDIK